MPTKYYNIKGKAYWPELRDSQPDEYAGDKRWKITLVLDDVDDFEKTGLQLKLRDMEDGQAIVLRRGCRKLIGDNLINFCSPVIIDENNKWIRYHTIKGEDGADKPVFSWEKGDPVPEMVGEDILINNGSEVSVRVAVYDTQKGKGHRMESVQILHMAAPYVKPTTENQEIEASDHSHGSYHSNAAEPSIVPEKTKTKAAKEEPKIKAPW